MAKNEATAESPPVSDRDMPKCVDCAKIAPPTGTNYTLISSRFGWRLTRSELDSGRKVMEWRCPACYARRARMKAGP
jgi:hypothetical protein